MTEQTDDLARRLSTALECISDHEHRIQRLEELVYRMSKLLNLAGSLLRISNVIEMMSKDQGETK